MNTVSQPFGKREPPASSHAPPAPGMRDSFPPSRWSSVEKHVQQELPEALQHPTVYGLLERSVAEDVDPSGTWTPEHGFPVQGDVTSAGTVPQGTRLEGRIVAREAGVVAGLPLARALIQLVDSSLTGTNEVAEGTNVDGGQSLIRVAGPGRALLTAERLMLNMIGRLSGVATRTRRFVDAVHHTDASILDTRKTLPGLRRPDKYAVRQGGATNHRMGLFDMVLIKENHIAASGGVGEAVRRAREMHGNAYPIEVEVTSLDELDTALSHSPDLVLLDNMEVPTLRQAIERTADDVITEASGNVTLDTVRTVAETGVDRISVGALTHSAPTLDLSFRTL